LRKFRINFRSFAANLALWLRFTRCSSCQSVGTSSIETKTQAVPVGERAHLPFFWFFNLAYFWWLSRRPRRSFARWRNASGIWQYSSLHHSRWCVYACADGILSHFALFAGVHSKGATKRRVTPKPLEVPKGIPAEAVGDPNLVVLLDIARAFCLLCSLTLLFFRRHQEPCVQHVVYERQIQRSARSVSGESIEPRCGFASSLRLCTDVGVQVL
jgi:hypothetical protein